MWRDHSMSVCRLKRFFKRMSLCQIIRKTLLLSAGIIILALLILTVFSGSFTKILKTNTQENMNGNINAQENNPKGNNYVTSLPITLGIQEERSTNSAHVQEDTISEESTMLQKTCKNLPASEQISGRNYTVNFIRDDKSKILFCEIFKCASTFWKSLLKESMQKVDKVEDVKSKADWFRFMFVREPYRRFMSFYVDKLYTPNSGFWRMFSELIPRCKNSKTKKKGCCEDVSFTELLQFVIQEVENKRPLDPHLTPMHEHCHPCENKFDFVGRMENFTHDAYYVFGELNSRTSHKITFEDFQQESRRAAVKEYVHRLYRHKLWINRCLPMYDAMLRTWKSLQIRGILDSRIPLPFSRHDADHIHEFAFSAAAFRALDQSTNKANLQRAKSEAVREIFSTVPRDTLLRIKEFVRPDCVLFGYELEPDEIFGDNKRLNSRTKYFVSLDEREYGRHLGVDKSKLLSSRVNAMINNISL